jgi:hypothetical protein
MRQSQVNLDFEFSEEIYTVSILNINTGGGLQTLMGHSTLVVEGLKSSVGASIATRELFVGQYDLLGDNENNVVTQIRVFEQNDYQRTYSNFPSASYYVKPEQVAVMIQSIKDDAERINGGEEMPFELVQLSRDGGSYNCTKWCYEKLELCGVDVAGKPKPKIAAGNCLLM